MPKTFGKASRCAKSKNERTNKEVLADHSALLGRAIKMLGNRRFRIQTTDDKGRATETEAAIRGNTIRIQVGDIVIVGRNESAGHVHYEILGSCDKKTVKQLRDVHRIHDALFIDSNGIDEDMFDRADEMVEEESKEKKTKTDAEEDVDINAI